MADAPVSTNIVDDIDIRACPVLDLDSCDLGGFLKAGGADRGKGKIRPAEGTGTRRTAGGRVLENI